jgi:hypothetical protein
VESYDRLEVLFWTIFDQKSGQLQKLFLEKKNWHLQNFNHGFLTYQSVFPQNVKKSKMTLFFFGLEHCRQKMNNWSPCSFFVPKFYITRPFQNAQILAIWFSKWKVITI